MESLKTRSRRWSPYDFNRRVRLGLISIKSCASVCRVVLVQQRKFFYLVSVRIVGVGKEGRTKVGPRGFLNRAMQHSTLSRATLTCTGLVPADSRR